MEAMSSIQACNGMVEHINKQIEQQNGSYPDWYCGITSNIAKRLYEEHSVPEKDWWLTIRKCFSDGDARIVEAELLELGCDGGEGGGDEDTVYVYAYLKGNITNP